MKETNLSNLISEKTELYAVYKEAKIKERRQERDRLLEEARARGEKLLEDEEEEDDSWWGAYMGLVPKDVPDLDLEFSGKEVPEEGDAKTVHHNTGVEILNQDQDQDHNIRVEEEGDESQVRIEGEIAVENRIEVRDKEENSLTLNLKLTLIIILIGGLHGEG